MSLHFTRPTLRTVAKITRPVALTVTLILASSAALAASDLVYTCVVNGKTLSSDRPIPECARQPLRETQRTGIVRIIPAPLTAEEKQKQDEERYKQRLIDDAAHEKLRRDRALLASYSSTDKIDEARQRALLDANEVIASTNDRLAALEKDRLANQKEADLYKDKPVPAMVQSRIETTDISIMLEKKSLVASKADVVRINQKYDAEKQRYQELITTSK